MRTCGIVLFCLLFAAVTFGAEPPKQDLVRPVPPPGVKISDADKTELENGLMELTRAIDGLRKQLKSPQAELITDAQIYQNAIRYALVYNEFFNETEIPNAKKLLAIGLERAKQLKEGRPAWTNAAGLLPRGYVSKIDGSIQPYGMVIPQSYEFDSGRPRRLDIWFHGRDERLSEVNFLWQRHNNAGQFNPPDTFVLHLYGRYCNANKFAGEVDLFEALAEVKKRYPIDENRILVRGFSMGGAACWQFATHFAGLWAAAAPGAGFSETANFCKIMQDPTNMPPSYEQTLWHIYDSTDYAVNLFNCPTVVYSGEKDRQKQAADMMEAALKAEGLTMTHIIGPDIQHRYHPDSKIEIDRRLNTIAARGRNPVPQKVKFTTWTLRYNEMMWVTIDAMGRHWERARVDAEITGNSSVKVTTKNVTALTLNMPSGYCPLDATAKPMVILDGKKLEAPPVQTDRSWIVHFRKTGRSWACVECSGEEGLHKRHGLQGPIDDAFMDSFIFVKPTNTALNEKTGTWFNEEMAHAIDQWRKTYRGEARVTTDDKLTDVEIAYNNIVLWGDIKSNKVLARIADRLPVKWNENGIVVGTRKFSADNHVVLLIFPNPLNPKRYVVLNSGITFREFHHLNNARQVAILPDYAVIDINEPPSPRTPGKVVDAGFFNDKWELENKK
ncbi:MAG: prolyl oligopeptidase family serine peptidase [Kiritimatiellae bacterium]|nr:prolyl oligopeptidase family serine peptidase [Kiritimatiellia bacterium]MDD5520564.1 prolyl oligopeptidase family serine peptidase [Kiritimatiellia bacterium]